jgi:hypothetical protein
LPDSACLRIQVWPLHCCISAQPLKFPGGERGDAWDWQRCSGLPRQGPYLFISIISNDLQPAPISRLSLTRLRSAGRIRRSCIPILEHTLPHLTAVSAFFGSIAAESKLPVGSGEDYLGRFPTSFTDVRLVFDWDMTATDLNEGLGGFFTRFPTPTHINGAPHPPSAGGRGAAVESALVQPAF